MATLFNIISKMESENKEIFNDYQLEKKTLYKTSDLYGQKVYRLCLPNFLGRDKLKKWHFMHDSHLTHDNLLCMFNTNFYTIGAGQIVKRIIQGCILCRLNQNKYTKRTSGQVRTHQDDMTIGKIWQTDISHMPRTKTRFKYLLVFSERISSYIFAIALKNVTSNTVGNALRIFCGIIPPFNF
jgi:hypothetical protein